MFLKSKKLKQSPKQEILEQTKFFLFQIEEKLVLKLGKKLKKYLVKSGMNNKRMMAIDFGDVKIGIAITDELKMIASPYLTINRKKTPDYISEIKNIIREKNIDTIVVGLPLNLNGEKSSQTKKTEKFIFNLENSVDSIVYTQDERLSSQEAERYLKQLNLKIGTNKEKVDQIAASIILNNFLSSQKNR